MSRAPVAAVCLALVTCLLSPATGDAEVRLPSIFGDHMVLQREMPVPVWGWASPGERITVTLAQQQVETTASGDGRWQMRLAPLSAGGPYALTVTGANTLTFSDILVGEVWFASGRSNMEVDVWSANNPRVETGQANYPQLRTFRVEQKTAFAPQSDCRGEWVVCSPATVGPNFSATGYYFGRELHRRLGVPVGIINASWGGAAIQPFMDRASFEADPTLRPLLEAGDKSMREFTDGLLETTAPQMAAWATRAEAAKAVGQPLPEPPPLPADPRETSRWPGTRPTAIYDGMIAPLVPYALRGAIWYQGESNTWEAYRYRKLFPAMIQGWRRAWGQGDFPFVFAQLANYAHDESPPPEGPAGDEWAELREAQAMALSLPSTAMAVTIDIGDSNNIHPMNKQEIGRRLALGAGHLVYGWKDEYSGPVYRAMHVESSAVHVFFDHAEGLVAAMEGAPRGFAIAGADRRFHWADARIEGETVVVSSPRVPAPVAVRYAWDQDPPNNLYNRAGLPAAPFRTDDWPGVTAGY